MNNLCYALPRDLSNFSAKKEARRMATKAWAKTYRARITGGLTPINSAFHDVRYTTVQMTLEQVCLRLCTSAYGVNIGEQIYKHLTPEAMQKISNNILELE